MTRHRKAPSLRKQLRAAEARIDFLENQLRRSEEAERNGRRLYDAAVRGRELLRDSVFGRNRERAVFSMVLETESNAYGEAAVYRITGHELGLHGGIAEPVGAPLSATSAMARELARRMPGVAAAAQMTRRLVDAARELGGELFGRSMDRATAAALLRSGGSAGEVAAR